MPLQWDQEKYTTGHAHIDEQHYELFDGLNSFLLFLKDADRINQPEEQEKAVELINFLGEYAVKHFHDEEEMFAQCEHPLKAVNEEEHKRFVAKYLEYKKELTAGAITRASLIKLAAYFSAIMVSQAYLAG
jgi:hemerythrin